MTPESTRNSHVGVECIVCTGDHLQADHVVYERLGRVIGRAGLGHFAAVVLSLQCRASHIPRYAVIDIL